MAIKVSGQVTRSAVADVPVKGRDTMGVKFVGVKGTDAVGAIALYPESDSDETLGQDQGNGDAENGAPVAGEGSVGDDVASQVTEPTTEENADE
jgi:DNA gyrase subunit A